MKDDGFKYAELPGGKLLKFPPKTTDRDISRAVRKELGITSQGELVMMEAVDDLIESTQAQNRLHEQQIEQLADTLNANASRISGELSDAIREMQNVVRSTDENLRKVMSTQANLVVKMEEAMGSLNKTMDHALGETVGMMDDSHSVAGGIMNAMRDVNTVVGALMHSIKEVSDLKKIRRKAYRNRDGSYTFETEFD